MFNLQAREYQEKKKTGCYLAHDWIIDVNTASLYLVNIPTLFINLAIYLPWYYSVLQMEQPLL